MQDKTGRTGGRWIGVLSALLAVSGIGMAGVAGSRVAHSWAPAPRPKRKPAESFAQYSGVPNYAAQIEQLLHWRRFPLRVAFKNDVTLGGQRLAELAQDGFDLWTDGTNGVVTYEIVAPDDRPDVLVSFAMQKSAPRNLGTLGVTFVSFESQRKTLYRANIHLNIWPDMRRWDLRRFRLSAAHEFGHALGINGHSRNPDDLMYFSSGYSRGLTWRDLNTLKIAYRNVRRFDSVPFLSDDSDEDKHDNTKNAQP